MKDKTTSVSSIVDASLWPSFRCYLVHEIIVFDLVADRALIEHTHRVNGSLTVLVSLNKYSKRTKWLSLVAHLIY